MDAGRGRLWRMHEEKLVLDGILNTRTG